jgi:hypothetical protein
LLKKIRNIVLIAIAVLVFGTFAFGIFTFAAMMLRTQT